MAFAGGDRSDVDDVDGIYTNIGGTLTEVVAEGDLLDGKTVKFTLPASIGAADHPHTGLEMAQMCPSTGLTHPAHQGIVELGVFFHSILRV